MSENKWTPGPWRYRPNEFDDWGVVKASDNFTICQCRRRATQEELSAHRASGTDPYEANARLVSASPAMAEALEELLACAKVRAGNVDPLFSEPIEKAEAALDLARGNSK